MAMTEKRSLWNMSLPLQLITVNMFYFGILLLLTSFGNTFADQGKTDLRHIEIGSDDKYYHSIGPGGLNLTTNFTVSTVFIASSAPVFRVFPACFYRVLQ